MPLNTRGFLLNQLKGKGKGTRNLFSTKPCAMPGTISTFFSYQDFKFMHLMCGIGLKVSLLLFPLLFAFVT